MATTAITASTFTSSLAAKLAERFGIDFNPEMLDVLRQTAFKGQVTDAQMGALMVVASQYGLNPWTKEIYAFPDKGGGIVPVVGVDGWSRIINERPEFDGCKFVMAPDGSECTAIIFRKDRVHPTEVTEYLAECKRGTDPWKSHPRRMLRHKALIQCARVAFGYTGIYDQDEAERIIERDMGVAEVVTPRTAAEYAAATRPQPSGEVDREQLLRDLEMIARSNDPAPQRVADLAKAWNDIGKDGRAAVGADELKRLKAIAEAEDAQTNTFSEQPQGEAGTPAQGAATAGPASDADDDNPFDGAEE
jgi:phage recombination protein Bet